MAAGTLGLLTVLFLAVTGRGLAQSTAPAGTDPKYQFFIDLINTPAAKADTVPGKAWVS
jgi:hypothetical protein